ncbi:MAG: hypothetical protein AAGC56_04045 [Pseudomonadota bacterium]
MAAFRFIAWFLLAISIALLGADAISSLEAGKPYLRSTADLLQIVNIDGVAMAQSAPGGLSGALSTLMALPLWGVLGPLGIVLTLVFRPID